LVDFHIIGPIVLDSRFADIVFSTILGWSYYGEKAAEYLLGNKVVKTIPLSLVLFVMIGSILSLNTVWTFADITNALMLYQTWFH